LFHIELLEMGRREHVRRGEDRLVPRNAYACLIEDLFIGIEPSAPPLLRASLNPQTPLRRIRTKDIPCRIDEPNPFGIVELVQHMLRRRHLLKQMGECKQFCSIDLWFRRVRHM